MHRTLKALMHTLFLLCPPRRRGKKKEEEGQRMGREGGIGKPKAFLARSPKCHRRLKLGLCPLRKTEAFSFCTSRLYTGREKGEVERGKEG